MLKISKWYKGKNEDSESLQTEESVEYNLQEPEGQKSTLQEYGLSEIEKGKVSIYNTRVSPANGDLIVSFFVSNGLSQKVEFSEIPLALLDPEKNVLAKQLFDGKVIGEIAGGTEKACVVRFDRKNVFVNDVPKDSVVLFDIVVKQKENVRIRYQKLPMDITDEQKQELERVLAELPPIKLGEVNFSPLYSQISNQGDFLANVIIRNAREKSITLRKIPLAIFDAHHEEISRGEFNPNDLILEPFKAVMWTFNFGPVANDKNFDLSTWSISVVRKESSVRN